MLSQFYIYKQGKKTEIICKQTVLKDWVFNEQTDMEPRLTMCSFFLCNSILFHPDLNPHLAVPSSTAPHCYKFG